MDLSIPLTSFADDRQNATTQYAVHPPGSQDSSNGLRHHDATKPSLIFVSRLVTTVLKVGIRKYQLVTLLKRSSI